jgi:hypothetical protein
VAQSSRLEPFAFLSSATADLEDFRSRLYELEKERLWISERHAPGLDPRLVPPFAILDSLAKQARRSRVFICVLRDHYGSSVFKHHGPFYDQESVSFLEAELCQAALFHANIHLIVVDSLNTNSKLNGLIDVIRAIRPDIALKRVVETDGARNEVRRILDQEEKKRGFPRTISQNEFVRALAARQRMVAKPVEFFDGVFRGVSARPDRDRVLHLLDQISEGMPQGQQLLRMWIALRELSAAPYTDRTFQEYLPLWDRALGYWSSAAAWYGLHGHLYAGRLAATNSILRIRQLHRVAGRSAEQLIHGTRGAIASEYYSIARLLPRGKEQGKMLADALAEVNTALSTTSGDPSGFHAIRGHIYNMQGEMGLAEKEFKKVLCLRRKRGDAGGIGEAEVDLGRIYLRRLCIPTGHSLIWSGVKNLKKGKRLRFLARAKRWLVLSFFLSGHPIKAINELCDMYELSEELELYDQIKPWLKSVYKLVTLVGLRKQPNRLE